MGQCSADLFPALGQAWCCAQVPAERISTFGTALIWPHCFGGRIALENPGETTEETT